MTSRAIGLTKVLNMLSNTTETVMRRRWRVPGIESIAVYPVVLICSSSAPA